MSAITELAQLNQVHTQRIALAVAAACKGREIALQVEDSDMEGWAYLCWRSSRESQLVRYVIASGAKRVMEAMLPQAQAEFQRQLREREEDAPEAANEVTHRKGSAAHG